MDNYAYFSQSRCVMIKYCTPLKLKLRYHTFIFLINMQKHLSFKAVDTQFATVEKTWCHSTVQ